MWKMSCSMSSWADYRSSSWLQTIVPWLVVSCQAVWSNYVYYLKHPLKECISSNNSVSLFVSFIFGEPFYPSLPKRMIDCKQVPRQPFHFSYPYRLRKCLVLASALLLRQQYSMALLIKCKLLGTQLFVCYYQLDDPKHCRFPDHMESVSCNAVSDGEWRFLHVLTKVLCNLCTV